MTRISFFMLLAAASFSLAAQQQQGTEKQQPPADQYRPQADVPQGAPAERSRVEGASGGTSPVPDEKRKAVGAGAGPHLKDNLPSPQKLPRDAPVEPSK